MNAEQSIFGDDKTRPVATVLRVDGGIVFQPIFCHPHFGWRILGFER